VTALAGDLACFQPAEVLQLLQLAQSSGRLVLERDGETAEVWFERGRLAGARTSRGGVRTGEIMVHRGWAPRALLDDALAAQSRAPGRPVGALLAERGVPAGHVAQAVQEAMRRVLYGVVLWRSGRFRFDPGEGVPLDDATAGLDLDRLILEAFRLADQAGAR
jgi:uncharacterized protein DUF4388